MSGYRCGVNDESGLVRQVLSVGYVPGVQPDKWLVRWRERHGDVPVTARRVVDPQGGLAANAGDDGFDVIFVREPDDAPRSAPEGLLRVPLHTETMAVLADKEHGLGAFDALTLGDLSGEKWLDPIDAISSTLGEVSAAVDLVAAGVGLLVLPLPYARSLSRRDVVVRPLEGVPATRMGVAWSPAREGDELVDEFVGIVRGRRASTSRGGAEPSREKRSAKEKTAAKARSRAERDSTRGGGSRATQEGYAGTGGGAGRPGRSGKGGGVGRRGGSKGRR